MPGWLRQYGPIFALGVAFNRVVPAWLFRCRWFRIYQRPVTAMSPPSEHPFEVRWAAPADLQRLDEIARPMGVPQSPDRLAVAAWQGRLIGCLGIAAGRHGDPELGFQVELDDRTAWIFQIVVQRDHREQGVMKRLVQFTTAQLAVEGVREQFQAITRFNRAAELAYRGGKCVGSVLCVRFLRWGFCACRGRPLSRIRGASSDTTRRPLTVRITVAPDEGHPG